MDEAVRPGDGSARALAEAVEAALAIGCLVPASTRLLDGAMVASAALLAHSVFDLPAFARYAAAAAWLVLVAAASACRLTARGWRARLESARARAATHGRVALAPVAPLTAFAASVSWLAVALSAPLLAHALAPGAVPPSLVARVGEAWLILTAVAIGLRYPFGQPSARD